MKRRNIEKSRYLRKNQTDAERKPMLSIVPRESRDLVNHAARSGREEAIFWYVTT